MDKKELIRGVKTRTQIPLLFNPLGVKAIAEIGVWRGMFFRRLIKPSCVEIAIAVDTWDARLLSPGGSTQVDQHACDLMLIKMHQLAKSCQRPKIAIGHGDSVEIAWKVDDQSLDFIYVDADHTYAGCLRDLEAWYPKLRDGGIFSGHDYFEFTYYVKYGVVQAVDEFRAKNKLSFFYSTKESYPSWFLIKGE